MSNVELGNSILEIFEKGDFFNSGRDKILNLSGHALHRQPDDV